MNEAPLHRYLYLCRTGDDFHFSSHEMYKLAVQKNRFFCIKFDENEKNFLFLEGK